MTEKRFTYDFVSVDCPMFYDNKEVIDYDDVVDCLNEQHEQIERLKRNFKALDEVKCELADENEQLKQTISKIDFAIIRKYDNSLENLLDEVYDGEYNKWIQKQLLRAKKLEKGDVND